MNFLNKNSFNLNNNLLNKEINFYKKSKTDLSKKILLNSIKIIVDNNFISTEESNKNDISFNNFIYLKKSSFISFFINNLIDVPVCFKKSKSLKKKNFELPILRFCNFLMKKGKKEKIFKFFFKSFRLFNETFLKEKKKDLFFFENFFENYKNLFNIFDKNLSNKFFIKNNIIDCITKINPIFSYFIYNVDKNIKKFSRGKSGKYVFIWKYIAPYKRNYISMKWLIKEIKFNNEKLFYHRIKKLFSIFSISMELTFAWKSKNFSHNYVFKNFKKNLLNNFLTTTS